MASHTQDDGFHEIQLNGKQLVFLFMAATVVSVVILLCGVLVGRGVRAERGTAVETAALADPAATELSLAASPRVSALPAEPPADAPRPAADDLSYFNRLDQPNPPVEELKVKATPAPAPAAKPERPAPALSPPAREPAAPAAAAAASRCRCPASRRNAALRRANRRAQRAQRGGCDGQTAFLQRICRVRPPACQRDPGGLSRPHRSVQYAARGGQRRRQTAEGRAVQALGHSLTSTRFEYALAAASGLLLALSFPRFGHPAFSWIALAPLLLALGSGSLRRAFSLGLTTGVVYFTGTLYWITRVMVVYGGLQTWVAVLVNALLVAYLALFPALFALVVRHTVARLGFPALLASPVVWVATELGRTHLFSGFPWVLLGYSQASVLPIAQLASLIGVYGVSALVAGASACLAAVAHERSRSSGRPQPDLESRQSVRAPAGRVGPDRRDCRLGAFPHRQG